MRFELSAVREINRARGNVVDRGGAIVGRRSAERRILALSNAAAETSGDAGVGGGKSQQRSVRRLLLAPELFDHRLLLARGKRYHRRLGALRHIGNGRPRRCRRPRLHRTLRRYWNGGDLNRSSFFTLWCCPHV